MEPGSLTLQIRFAKCHESQLPNAAKDVVSTWHEYCLLNAVCKDASEHEPIFNTTCANLPSVAYVNANS